MEKIQDILNPGHQAQDEALYDVEASQKHKSKKDGDAHRVGSEAAGSGSDLTTQRAIRSEHPGQKDALNAHDQSDLFPKHRNTSTNNPDNTTNAAQHYEDDRVNPSQATTGREQSPVEAPQKSKHFGGLFHRHRDAPADQSSGSRPQDGKHTTKPAHEAGTGPKRDEAPAKTHRGLFHRHKDTSEHQNRPVEHGVLLDGSAAAQDHNSAAYGDNHAQSHDGDSHSPGGVKKRNTLKKKHHPAYAEDATTGQASIPSTEYRVTEHDQTSPTHFGRDTAVGTGAGLGAAAAYHHRQTHENSTASEAPIQQHAQDKFLSGGTRPVQTNVPFGGTKHQAINYDRDAAVGAGVGLEAAAVPIQHNHHNASDPQSTSFPDSGPASKTQGPHQSNILNVVDPRVQPDWETARETNEAKEDLRKEIPGSGTHPASHTQGPHESNFANIVDPRVKPDWETARQTNEAKEGLRREAFGSSPASTGGGGSVPHPATHTQGPHHTNTANDLDPRVQPDLTEAREMKEARTGSNNQTFDHIAPSRAPGASGSGGFTNANDGDITSQNRTHDLNPTAASTSKSAVAQGSVESHDHQNLIAPVLLPNETTARGSTSQRDDVSENREHKDTNYTAPVSSAATGMGTATILGTTTYHSASQADSKSAAVSSSTASQLAGTHDVSPAATIGAVGAGSHSVTEHDPGSAVPPVDSHEKVAPSGTSFDSSTAAGVAKPASVPGSSGQVGGAESTQGIYDDFKVRMPGRYPTETNFNQAKNA